MPERSFELVFGGLAGWTYQVETSTNLSDWEPLAILDYTNGPAQVRDPGATTNAWRFYRAKLLR